MTQHAIDYAKVLFDLNIPEESIHNTAQLILENRELIEALSNPAIKKNEKSNVIDAIFDQEVRSFLKVLCDNECFEIVDEILEAYNVILLNSKNIIKATITFVTRPDDDQLEKIKAMVCKKYNKSGVLLELKEDSSLLGGFILSVGDMVYDKSIRGTLSNLHKTLVWR